MKQTIAQQINWDFETNGNLELKDKNGNRIYFENSDGFWVKREYDSQGNVTYYESSSGFWSKREYDSQGNRIYYEHSNGFWGKWEYDYQGKEIYYEDSDGTIEDNRPKHCDGKVVEIEGVKYKLTKV
jgi:YD repeat-containing protein